MQLAPALSTLLGFLRKVQMGLWAPRQGQHPPQAPSKPGPRPSSPSDPRHLHGCGWRPGLALQGHLAQKPTSQSLSSRPTTRLPEGALEAGTGLVGGGLQGGTRRAGPAGLGRGWRCTEGGWGLAAVLGGTISYLDKLFTSRWPSCCTGLPPANALTCAVKQVGEMAVADLHPPGHSPSFGPLSGHVNVIHGMHTKKPQDSLQDLAPPGEEGTSAPAREFWRPEAQHQGTQEAGASLGNCGHLASGF
ncbi:Hypothetical predicted protein [Marmota monax]|uniref:Uncharacterized protein n=1 Tax=Marmota monax TaxID=9995 RepID=A0A5E4A9S2_MARMO|nr:Hypothetical predicted protein [Marmota monax]